MRHPQRDGAPSCPPHKKADEQQTHADGRKGKAASPFKVGQKTEHSRAEHVPAFSADAEVEGASGSGNSSRVSSPAKMIFMSIFISANRVQFQPKDLLSAEKPSDDTVQLLGVFYSSYLPKHLRRRGKKGSED